MPRCQTALLLAVLLVVSACSSSSSGAGGAGGGGSEAGSAATFDGGDWEGYGTELQLRIASFDNLCGIRQAGGDKANGMQIEIDLPLPAGQTALAAGTYAVSDLSVELKGWDSSCNDESKLNATGGSLTLTSAIGDTSSPVSGSYSFQFEDGSTLAGAFSLLAYCDTSSVTKTVPCSP